MQLRAACGLLLDLLVGSTALAQKQGDILKMYHFDSPASLSLHEEVTFAALGPAMGLFNNLVMFDQHVPQASFASIVPDLATERSWDSSKTELRYRLREARGIIPWRSQCLGCFQPPSPTRRPAGSFLGGCWTPALRARGNCHDGPASETLHRLSRPRPPPRTAAVGMASGSRRPN